jgi:hypothetical protein
MWIHHADRMFSRMAQVRVCRVRVWPVAAEDDDVDAQRADEDVDRLPAVRGGVDEHVGIDEETVATACGEPLVVRWGQPRAGHEAQPQLW